MTGLPLNGRRVDLLQLQAELNAAGITVPALGIGSDALFTYDAAGTPIDPPPGTDAVVVAHSPSTALRDQLVSTLQSSVGVTLNALTQAQRLALVAGLLYKAGGVDRQGQIRPLDQWLVT